MMNKLKKEKKKKEKRKEEKSERITLSEDIRG